MKTRKLFPTHSSLGAAIAVLAAFLTQFAAPSALADTYYWDSNGDTAGFGSTTGIWGTDAFWTTVADGSATHSAFTTPTIFDTVNFGTATLNYANGTVGVAVAGASVNNIIIGSGQTTAITLGAVGAGVLTSSGGIDMSAAGANLTILADYMPSIPQNLSVAANRTLTFSNVLANITSAAFGNISGPGTVRIVGAARFVRELTNSATLIIDGGSISAAGGVLTTGAGAGDTVRTVITNGGSANITNASGSSIILGFHGTGTNILNLESGSSINITPSTGASSSQIQLGSTTSTAILNLNGGTITLSPKTLANGTTAETTLRVGAGNGAKGILNLNGGTAIVPHFTNTAGSFSTINFNGTTVVGNKTNTTWISGMTAANVQAGGAIFDSSNFVQTISQALLHDAALGSTPDGGLVKLGVGRLTLSGASTYTGGTTISNGTLALTNSGAIASSASINVQSGATFNVTAVSGGFTLAANQTLKGNGTVTGPVTINGTLSPGASIGTLTSISNLVLNASSTNTFEVDGSTPTNDVIVLGAAVTYGGVLNIVPTGTFTAGQTFTLFSGAGATNVSNFASLVGSPGSGKVFSFTNGVLTVVSTGPSGPALLTNSVSGGVLSLAWPAGQGWRLQSQTNALTVGLGTNWVEAANSSVSSTNLTIDSTLPTMFYRLVYP